MGWLKRWWNKLRNPKPRFGVSGKVEPVWLKTKTEDGTVIWMQFKKKGK